MFDDVQESVYVAIYGSVALVFHQPVLSTLVYNCLQSPEFLQTKPTRQGVNLGPSVLKY